MLPNSDKDLAVVEMVNSGRYEVQKDGTVISYKQNKIGRLLTPVTSNGGYLRYQLFTDDRKPITVYCHRMVALALIPNPLNLEQVNHIDGNKENFHPTNLEWVSPSENQIHAITTGLKLTAMGSQLSDLTEEDVSEIKHLYSFKLLNQRQIGELYGRKQNTISMIVNNKNWRHT